jgi:hypothetical protein
MQAARFNLLRGECTIFRGECPTFGLFKPEQASAEAAEAILK